MPRSHKHRYVVPSLVAVIIVIAVIVAIKPSTASPSRSPAVDPLIVHEWGTFTSMVGANGMVLEGMQHAEETLPKFVHTRTSEVADPFRNYGNRSVNQRNIRRTRTKMETPVIYFYSKKKRRVKVRVDYTMGLLSQYYPAPSKLGPAGNGVIDLSRLPNSFLEWDVELLPGLDDSKFPTVGAHPYGYARQVKATALRNLSGSTTPQYERFLFYRGLGYVTPPLLAYPRANNRVTLVSNFTQTIPAAFAIEMRGNRGRFVALGAVNRSHARVVDLSKARFMAKDRIVALLAAKVLKALTKAGLYNDEARAMVRTWTESWFAAEGTRVVYVVPRKWTDNILPLKISPQPDALVRVLVGRLDYLTPEHEAYVERALLERMSANLRTREAAKHRLGKLGRFIEPKVRRTLQKTRSTLVKRSARQVLAAIKRRAGS